MSKKKQGCSFWEDPVVVGVIADIQQSSWDEKRSPTNEDGSVNQYVISDYIEDVLSEYVWRKDPRASGRRRVWCPGHAGRWNGSWHHQEEIDAAREFLCRPDVEMGLSWYPAFSGCDFGSSSSGAVMAAMEIVWRQWKCRLDEDFDEEEYLARPGMRDLAFEIGFTGELEDWDLVDLCMQLDVRLAWYEEVGLS